MKYNVGVILLGMAALAPQPSVRVAGAMRNIMMRADLSAYASLDSLARQPNLYGLGPVAGLQGEIMVLNSKPYVCAVRSEKPVVTIDSTAKAAMFVYASVPRWKTVSIDARVNSFTDLERQLPDWCRANGYDSTKPFPFRIQGKVTKALCHVINWRSGALHTTENHKQFALNQQILQREVELLGFYSNQHHGIFTHHSTNLHIHLLTTDQALVAHLDDIIFEGSIKLLLPD